ncbi:MAG: hypothetical protein AAGI01_04745, partial [Myxococcota bacterium]
MLKRFLQFFKTHDDEDMPHFEGSYLDFVLEQSKPGVIGELEACREHDPLLLIIAEILRVSMEGTWSTTLRRPLIDQHSPLHRPNQASPPPPPSALEETGEFETLVVDDAAESDAPDEDESKDTSEEPTGPEAKHEAQEDTAPVDEDEAESLDEAMILEEDDLTETEEHFPPPLEAGRHNEDTAQFDAVDVEEGIARDDEDLGEDGQPRVDKSEVLQAGRVYLGMLIENDRLPVDLHLGMEETLLARDLLVGYFVGHQDFETKAQKLLRIVEQKFSEGQFSQARILLQLFQTDRDTRIRNDRNIFYEDMIQRLGIRRRHPVSEALQQEFEELAHPDDPSTHVNSLELLAWLDAHLFIKMNIFVRQPDQVAQWLEVGHASSLPGAADNLMRYLPPRRWRSAILQPAPLDQLIAEHVNNETLSLYIINLMRTCYFVLR